MNKSALNILQVLLTVSERAADIARIIRVQKDLFESLIEEKKSDFKQHDYKTLADVLVQATVKYHVSKEFPSMKDEIHGEESAQFINGAGQEVFLDINDSPINTKRNLELAFEGRPLLVEDLTKIIHDDRQCNDIQGKDRDRLEGVVIDTSSIGIWIDPIDGTNEYIRGEVPVAPVTSTGIHRNGIWVALVLIGLYDTKSGIPIMGIINQPFHSKNECNKWNGRVVWGVAKDDCKVASIPTTMPVAKRNCKICLLSSVDSLEFPGWETHYVSGCGYKFLCVIDGLADAFILTTPSSYKWDTCGPQAILTALGGKIISWAEFRDRKEEVPLSYHCSDTPTLEGTQKWSNVGGVIAYQEKSMIKTLIPDTVLK